MRVLTTPGKSRHYYREGAPDIRHPGVTSIVDMLPKNFLPRWAANEAAELALDSIDYLQRMADRDRSGAKKYIAGASERYTNQRAAAGTKAHIMFEKMMRGAPLGRVHPDMEPYRRHFAEFVGVVRPELVRAEDVAWSDTHAYGGSFDAWLRLRVAPQADGTWKLDPDNISGEAIWVDVVADWKTSKSTWPSVAIQLAGYGFADLIISPDGDEQPMPDFDGAVVLHITPDGWELIPVYLPALREAFGVFLALRKDVMRWERELSRRVLGKPLATSSKGLVTGTERRA
ncbi:hypothetical protein PV729_04285 [Streptomyces europaeiscabiei]|uniref:PD-(D/E)XK endonuclease-like domain-containing protein n=1 Tax=Streptomyces europaeiscabiei TaxID=146819 RepID=A0ABU4N822_9ACTN|nr:hypothetical protein [Streptomyces europaeiscabiei]MDX3550996.1 hypothetical protein [Streptomyces europaeiscabiei]MDX3698444.1 hypothetical protein [Streptomyces europaeiscabiei]